MNIFLISILILIINIPFGYWRGGQKKYSLKWFLAIHIPIPFIILLRIYSGVGFEWCTYPYMITAFFFGQLAGSKLRALIAD
jgi:hypothetical protein